MENNLSKIIDNLPEFIKNSGLKISLEGWPAAVTAIAVCGSTVALYAIKVAKAV